MSSNPFSWDEFKKHVVEKKIERAKTLSIVNQNPDWKAKYPDWCRDAVKGDFTILKTQVRKQVENEQRFSMSRRDKLAGRS